MSPLGRVDCRAAWEAPVMNSHIFLSTGARITRNEYVRITVVKK